MPDPRHRLGLDAEEATARWLTGNGWRVLARRYRPTAGAELDLVTLDPLGVLVAVEVRARRSSRSGAAAATVDDARMRRMRKALIAFAASAHRGHHGLRVDVVAAEPAERAPSGSWRLRRFPGAS